MKTGEIGLTQQRQHLSQRPSRALRGAYLGVRSSSARRYLRFDGDRGLGRVFGRGFGRGFGLLGGRGEKSGAFERLDVRRDRTSSRERALDEASSLHQLLSARELGGLTHGRTEVQIHGWVLVLGKSQAITRCGRQGPP